MGVDLDATVGLSAEKQELTEQMVEPPAVHANHEDAAGAKRQRGIERELQISRILCGRVALDSRPCPLESRKRLRGERVKVSDRDIDVQAERKREVCTAVRGNDTRAIGDGS